MPEQSWPICNLQLHPQAANFSSRRIWKARKRRQDRAAESGQYTSCAKHSGLAKQPALAARSFP